MGNYLKSKKIILDILIQFSEKIKIDNIRIEHIFGKNDAEGKFIPNVLKESINNSQLFELTEGKQKRDFIYLPQALSLTLSTKFIEMDE